MAFFAKNTDYPARKTVRAAVIIIMALVFGSIASADVFDGDSSVLHFKGSHIWRGITDFASDDSMIYSIYKSGLAIYRPNAGFLGVDTVSMVPFKQSYERGLKLRNEILLYSTDGRVGFVFVKNPHRPRLLVETDLKTEFIDIAYYRLNVYVACGFDGVKVYNFQDRDNHFYKTTLAQPAHPVAVRVYGDLLYVVDDYNGIYIYDLGEDAGDPEFLGSLLFEHPVRDIAFKEGRGYAANSDSGTAIMDLSDPRNPEFIGRWPTETSIIGVEIIGGYLFARDVYGGFEIYHPDTISQLGILQKGNLISDPDFYSNGSGDYLLWADTAQVGRIFRIMQDWELIEITNLGKGHRLGQCELLSTSAYISSGSDPLLRFRVSSDYSLSHVTDYPARVDALARLDDLLFLADNGDGLLWIARISGPSTLSTLGFLPLEDQALDLQAERAGPQAVKLAIYGKEKVFLYELNMQTFMPNSYSRINLVSDFLAGRLYGERLYVSSEDNGLRLYDIGNIANPALIGEAGMQGPIYALNLDGERLYTGGGAGMVIYNLVDALPESIDRIFDNGSDIYTIIIKGSMVFCAAGRDGILALREFESDSFAVAGHYQTPGFADHMAYQDSLLMVSDGYGLLLFETASGGSSAEEDTGPIPRKFYLAQNYPNPFNQSTIIEVDIAQGTSDQRLEIAIYNCLGQRVRILADESAVPGYHSYKWDGKDDSGEDLASGIYIYRCRVGGIDVARKMILMK